jgi:hypothetical protein
MGAVSSNRFFAVFIVRVDGVQSIKLEWRNLDKGRDSRITEIKLNYSFFEKASKEGGVAVY